VGFSFSSNSPENRSILTQEESLMATAPALISIDEYLRTSYHPDVDFVDGQIEKRNSGEREHGLLQSAITAWFFSHAKTWNIYSIVGQRVRVAPKRVRICDVCLISRDAPREQVTQTPPLACIEILSPEDRLYRAAKVMEDYARMGVQNLWLLDPIDRIAYLYTGEGQFKIVEDRLAISNTPIHLDLPTLFDSVS
jgi:Uma2 family endonuclease